MFRDPIRQFVERLDKAGVDTYAHEVPGMFHVFQILMPWAEASRTIYDRVGIFFERIVGGAPPLRPYFVAGLPGG
jgi:acetyl esterase/lipase